MTPGALQLCYACPKGKQALATVMVPPLLCGACAQAFAATGRPELAVLAWCMERWEAQALARIDAKKAAKKLSEGAIQKRIKDALGKMPWVHVERVQSGTTQDDGHYVHHASRGTSDLMGWVTVRRTLADGKPWAFARALGLEVKSLTGKLRPDQIKWAQQLVDDGGYWACVRSPEEAVKAVTAAARFEIAVLPQGKAA